VRARPLLALIVALLVPLSGALSQEHHGAPAASGALPTQTGQDAFAAISELVRILEADPRTDWSRVDLEAVRKHLIDMNDVVLRSSVTSTNIPGGAKFAISGTGSAAAAIGRMIAMHAMELEKMPQWRASAKPTPDGAELTVVARSPADAATVTRIRGLGFIGLLATGAHHQEHHLSLATGRAASHH
jgi:hypothetical protein